MTTTIEKLLGEIEGLADECAKVASDNQGPLSAVKQNRHDGEIMVLGWEHVPRLIAALHLNRDVYVQYLGEIKKWMSDIHRKELENFIKAVDAKTVSILQGEVKS